MSGAATGTDETGTELIELARSQSGLTLPGRKQAVATGLGAVFIAAAVCSVLFLPAGRPFSITAAAIAVLAYAVVSRVEFEVSNGFVVPTELVLVPMLFTLPLRSVPLVVAAGVIAGESRNLFSGRLPFSHYPLLLVRASYSLGPVLVLAAAGARQPAWKDVPVYLAALAAQFLADFASSAVWSRLGYGIPVAEHARATRVPVLLDAALAPVGLVVAIAAAGRSWGVLLVLPLVALLKVFARERQVRIDHALELSHAYRGTAMLLGEVIEADDEYTGSHSRDVVDLVVAVATRLGLSPSDMRQAEFAAMLHDVGKVKIPAELINKPGPLDAEERALMQTHTIVGESMLEQVGGLLGDVGRIVRSCHEHWDGGGYPDGLAGEQIPLAARIVCACDAWNAMTTDRSYRRALSREQAAAELGRCAGSQFDPRVVETLNAVLDL
jgi:HD-GYP domain-containing protein (c-di-GMP phosphodiesterase class II)